MSDFKLNVKHRLLDMGKSQAWLIDEIRTRGECYVDGSYLNKIYSGERNAPKIKKLICEILEIEGSYENSKYL